MIGAILASAMLAASPVPPEARDELAHCLAHLSNAPEYKHVESAELGRSEQFLDSAIGSYCSDEAGALWPEAHEQARENMGLPPEGGRAPGQYAAAKRLMIAMTGEVWQTAQAYRADPPPMTPAKLKSMALAWLLDDRNAAVLQRIEQPLMCVGKGAAKGKATFSAGGVTPSSELASSCGYDAAAEQIAAMLRGRFPDAPPEFAPATATVFLEQMALWASLSAPNMR